MLDIIEIVFVTLTICYVAGSLVVLWSLHRRIKTLRNNIKFFQSLLRIERAGRDAEYRPSKGWSQRCESDLSSMVRAENSAYDEYHLELPERNTK